MELQLQHVAVAHGRSVPLHVLIATIPRRCYQPLMRLTPIAVLVLLRVAAVALTSCRDLLATNPLLGYQVRQLGRGFQRAFVSNRDVVVAAAVLAVVDASE